MTFDLEMYDKIVFNVGSNNYIQIKIFKTLNIISTQ